MSLTHWTKVLNRKWEMENRIERHWHAEGRDQMQFTNNVIWEFSSSDLCVCVYVCAVIIICYIYECILVVVTVLTDLKIYLINSYCNACNHLVRIYYGYHRCQLLHQISFRFPGSSRDLLVHHWIYAIHIHSCWHCKRSAFPLLVNQRWNHLAGRMHCCSRCTNLCIDRRPLSDDCDDDDADWGMHWMMRMMVTMCNALVSIFRLKNHLRGKHFAHTNVPADHCSQSWPINRDWLVLRVVWEHMVYDDDLDSLEFNWLLW